MSDPKDMTNEALLSTVEEKHGCTDPECRSCPKLIADIKELARRLGIIEDYTPSLAHLRGDVRPREGGYLEGPQS